MLDYTLYKIGEFLALSLPWSLAYKLGAFLANLQFLFSNKDREAVISNLKVILPGEDESAIRKKAKEVFINFGLYLVEFFRYANIDDVYIRSHFSVIGKENIDNALKKGKGAVLVTAHLGNWETAGMVLSLLGYRLIAIALDHKDPKVNEFFKKRRQDKGMEVVSLGVSVKQCFKALRNNKLVAILGDRDFSDSGYSLDFLGRKKKIPRGPAVLALRTGAPIIPVLVTRKGLDRVNIECFSPIEILEDSGEIDIMKKYTTIIERAIYENPSQWLMFREFWKE